VRRDEVEVGVQIREVDPAATESKTRLLKRAAHAHNENSYQLLPAMLEEPTICSEFGAGTHSSAEQTGCGVSAYQAC
jgi:hypothetical protein